jgi:cyanuric acid amidohydrolase
MIEETEMECSVHRVPMRHPGDVSAVLRLTDDGALAADSIVAIFGKTEGNGCVNDFTRSYALSALSAALAPRLGIDPEAVPSRIAMVMSGGTEGGLSPHFLIFATTRGSEPLPHRKALAIGTATTEPLRPEDIGRMAQVNATATAVRSAMGHANIDADDVHWVQVKCPLLTKERIAEAAARGTRTATTDTYASMGLSRGAGTMALVTPSLAKLNRTCRRQPRSMIRKCSRINCATAARSSGLRSILAMAATSN